MTPRTSMPGANDRASAGRRILSAFLASFALTAVGAQAADTSPARQLERFGAEAGRPGQAERGRLFFTGRQGGEWSCASCHGERPVSPGRHAGTGKTIDPLAPAFNPEAFSDAARVDKWFRRNCRDVARRECSAAEKADVLAYLISLNR